MKSKLFLVCILALSLFLRTYRLPDMLGFWYDQGRDAKVVWDIWHGIKFTLIGPTTGIEGIFLGPFYYYIITPLYMLGQGNPVYPAVGLALLSTLSIYILYRLGKEYVSTTTGLLAAALYGLSFTLVSQNRWLSNPTPLPFFALLAIWCLLKIIHRKALAYHWLGLGLTLGLSLQLEAATAIFFLPATAIILFINHKSTIYSFHEILHLIFAFVLTLLPQLIFNLRHDQILFKSFADFLITKNSFQAVPIDFIPTRLQFYYDCFTKILYLSPPLSIIFLPIITLLFILVAKKISHRFISTLLVLLFTPIIMLLFYHGNNGYVWDYYFTGVFGVFLLLVSAIWVTVYHNYWWLRVCILLFLLVFLFQNLTKLHQFFASSLPAYVTLSPIIESVDWVYQDAGHRPFNVDIYVPPIISHSYDYVFLWRGTQKFKSLPSDATVPLLYTLLEPDAAKWRGLWLDRQNGLSTIKNETSIGPILVQKRTRK